MPLSAFSGRRLVYPTLLYRGYHYYLPLCSIAISVFTEQGLIYLTGRYFVECNDVPSPLARLPSNLALFYDTATILTFAIFVLTKQTKIHLIGQCYWSALSQLGCSSILLFFAQWLPL